ncbi:tRNA lysidine(34) synthetase TilS [Peribacillus sp. SCS-155]|uniref:tRNA lysidine(34) synthetase TilS n=1 Tax=Peribacillus sedimenti TaxID=3115297 RepID=UPI003906C6D1
MFKRKVLDFIYQWDLLPKDARVLVGVSGGPDSLALLHFLRSIQRELHFEMVAAHVDHMFRAEESYQDLLFVEQICKQWKVPFEGRRIDVPEKMAITGESTQSAARRLRYSFFEEVMAKRGLTTLALGHHGDDQMETMLMRITRGASGTARAGMPVKRPFAGRSLIRPFLILSKDEILAYTEQHSLEPRIDPSNAKDAYLRNRFRHSVLPFLKSENKNAHEHYQRFSEELYEDEQFLLEAAEKRLKKVWNSKTPHYASIDIRSFQTVPKPLQRRMIQLILKYLYIERPSSLSALHIDQLLALFLRPQSSAELHLPEGLIVEKSYDNAIFRFFQPKSPKYYLTLNIPGEIILPNGYKIKAHYIEEENPDQSGNHSFILKTPKAKLPLIIRTRKDGDRMSVKGLGGTKKLKDIFINEKIPKAERDAWPVVLNHKEEIIWLPGLKKSAEESDETHGEQSFIYLEYRKA